MFAVVLCRLTFFRCLPRPPSQALQRLEQDRAMREAFGGLLAGLWALAAEPRDEPRFVAGVGALTAHFSEAEFAALLCSLEGALEGVEGEQRCGARSPTLVLPANGLPLLWT